MTDHESVEIAELHAEIREMRAALAHHDERMADGIRLVGQELMDSVSALASRVHNLEVEQARQLGVITGRGGIGRIIATTATTAAAIGSAIGAIIAFSQ